MCKGWWSGAKLGSRHAGSLSNKQLDMPGWAVCELTPCLSIALLKLRSQSKVISFIGPGGTLLAAWVTWFCGLGSIEMERDQTWHSVRTFGRNWKLPLMKQDVNWEEHKFSFFLLLLVLVGNKCYCPFNSFTKILNFSIEFCGQLCTYEKARWEKWVPVETYKFPLLIK